MCRHYTVEKSIYNKKMLCGLLLVILPKLTHEFIRIKDQYIDNAEFKGIEEEQGEFLLGLPAVLRKKCPQQWFNRAI